MRAFITGANGFIGSHLVPILLKRGCEVVCVVRDPAKADRLAKLGARLSKGDVTERESMRESMRGSDVVFHLAGWYAIGNHDKAKMAAINLEGARNTLELAAVLGVPKIIHTSTVGVFGNTNGRIVDESHRAGKEAMSTEYERTKWAAHYEVAVPLQQRGAPVIIVQPGGVTGKGDPSPHVQTFHMFLRRTPVMLGAQSGITLAHVDDIAEGHALAMEKGKPGESYILAGPCLTYRQAFELCEKIAGLPATKVWLPGWVAATMSKLAGLIESMGMSLQFSAEALGTLADYTFWGSADKAKRELGWTLRPVEDVLKEVLEYERAKMNGIS
jgi:nucleoside-diphosphate-sugar epimerase